MIGTTISHYQVEEKLGGGGMGVVYRARDTRLNRDVALKFLPPALSHDAAAKERFVREARAASALDHPNICTIHDIGETDDGRLFIAMSAYAGQTLRQVLEGGAVVPERAAAIASKIASGLAAAHEAGIVHRDIKPANIMLMPGDRVRILDFGVAKLESGIDLTKQGSTVGTTSYMSPEQARGEEVDGRSDLWSLGVILYELLSGKRPFSGEYESAILYAVLKEAAAPLEEAPERLADLVDRLLSKDAAFRPGTAAEVVEALAGAASPHHILGSVASARLKWGIPVLAVLPGALLWFAFTRGSSDLAEEALGADPNLLVVLPFDIQGEAATTPEGMATLLGEMLDGAGALKTVDNASVLEYLVGQGNVTVGPSAGSQVAHRFGASRFVLGSVVPAGREFRINAYLYDQAGNRQGEASGAYTGPDNFIPAMNGLAGQLFVSLAMGDDHAFQSLASKTTDSFDAVKHYLEADRLYRLGEIERANTEIDAALGNDSTYGLAWYLKAAIAGWSGGDPEQAYIRRAKSLEDQLSLRVRRLVDGRLAFADGRDRDAERLFRSVLADYPADIEALENLAETLVHYRPLASELDSALALLEDLTRMAPAAQSAMHHSGLIAYRHLFDGDYYQLDSLAAVYAGMPVPARGEPLDWSTALDRMSQNARGFMTMWARLRGTPEDSLESYQIRSNALDAARFWSYGHLDLAEATLDNAETDNPGLRWAIAGTRGQFALARRIASESIGYGPLLVSAALYASTDAYEISPDSLATLQHAMVRWDPRIHPLEGETWTAHPQSTDAIKHFLLALLSLRAGDEAGFERERLALTTPDDDSPADRVLTSMQHELAALRLWIDGNLTEAIELLRDALDDKVSFGLSLNDPLAGRRTTNWFLANLLEQEGALEEALERYTASYWHVSHAVPGWERAAELEELRGRPERAVRYYDLLISHWKDADAELQPRIEEAKRRRESLLDAAAREPSS